jgi:hypothetical protein
MAAHPVGIFHDDAEISTVVDERAARYGMIHAASVLHLCRAATPKKRGEM